jgi:ABC-type transport system involved in multi-copper enzyme maturation permease subunit
MKSAADRSARSFSGLVAAAFVLVIGQAIFAFVRTPILRIAVALAFAIPAALAGCYATFGLSGLTITSDLCVIGAVAVGATAWIRLAATAPNMPFGSGRARRPAAAT